MIPLQFSNMFFIFIVLLISFAMFIHRRKSFTATNWPIVGMAPDIVLNRHRIYDFATYNLKLHSGTLLVKGPWFTNMNMLVTSDPANINHILSKNFHNYPKGPEYHEIFDFLGEGVFNSDHELWEFHRKTLLVSLFKHHDFLTLLETNTRNKIEKALFPIFDLFASRHQEIDLQEVLQRFTFDATCVLLLNYDPESLSLNLPHIPCERAFTEIEEAVMWRHVVPEKLWKLQKRFGLGTEKILKKALINFDEFIYKCLSLKEVYGEEGSVLLTSLIRCYEAKIGNSKNSKHFAKETVLNLMLAGRDTTSATLSWFFYLVAQHPSVERKIREEVENKLGGRKWNTLGVKDLGGLVYLHGSICETLRLYPPLGIEHKSPVEDDVLPSGHVANKHARIVLSFYSMGRMERIWGEDCMEFKPERWFEPGGGIKHEPSFKFTAFNAGPRTCLGKEMSFVQMKMVASAIIYHYHVEVVKGQKVTPSESIMLQMKYGLKVRLLPINNNNNNQGC
ncbi:alkane hydroxylase MAH1-like [Rutidosis leptorrhynchoides]|uniref:alkane hydroxylase MAH1-like n=1 Tax=Rutidosis leptorrhynchoides TaxID=125765 RepID=UPI003A99E5AB